MRTDLFDFELPAESIALRPVSPRDSARMLVVVPPDGVLRDCSVADLPDWLEAGDQLVVNDTRVISAQLSGRRIGRDTEPRIEATLIKRLDGARLESQAASQARPRLTTSPALWPASASRARELAKIPYAASAIT